MIEKDDWRLNGQEEFLRGQALYHRIWAPHFPQSDHSHCIFCWAKFSELADTLHEGYLTQDSRHWICPECFRDFQAMFGWKVIEDAI